MFSRLKFLNTSGPYPRAFMVGAGWYLAVILNSVWRSSGIWSSSPGTLLVAFAFAWVITALLVGVAAIKFQALQSWLGTAMGTVVASLAVMALMVMVKGQADRAKVPEFKSTDEMMTYFAGQATNWVKADRNVTLDFSLESVKIIDQELSRLAKLVDKQNPPPGIDGTALTYGAYVGEVIRRQMGGTWEEDHPVGGPKSFPLVISTNQAVFPGAWCLQRLLGGEEDVVYPKAAQALIPGAPTGPAAAK